MKIPPIETPRLTLRGFTKDDALWAYSIWNDPEMGHFLPDETKTDIDWAYVRSLEGLGDDAKCCYLIPVLKGTDKRVGTCSFMVSGNGRVFDLAYCVHKDFWRQGYATEMAQGMMAYARSQGAETATIWVSRDNAASHAVAKKCGGRLAGEKSYKKHGAELVMTEDLYEVTL